MKLYKNLKLSEILTILVLITLTTAVAYAADWPNYRGPDYNGISKEIPSIATWTDGKPNILWKASTSAGFSSVTISNGKLYTLGNNGKKGIDESKHKDIIYCLDAKTGKEIWTYKRQSLHVEQKWKSLLPRRRYRKTGLVKRLRKGFRRRSSHMGLCRLRGNYRRSRHIQPERENSTSPVLLLRQRRALQSTSPGRQS